MRWPSSKYLYLIVLQAKEQRNNAIVCRGQDFSLCAWDEPLEFFCYVTMQNVLYTKEQNRTPYELVGLESIVTWI